MCELSHEGRRMLIQASGRTFAKHGIFEIVKEDYTADCKRSKGTEKKKQRQVQGQLGQVKNSIQKMWNPS